MLVTLCDLWRWIIEHKRPPCIKKKGEKKVQCPNISSEIYVKSILRQNTPNISDFQKMILILKRFNDLIHEFLVCLMTLVNDGIDNNSLYWDFNKDCTL